MKLLKFVGLLALVCFGVLIGFGYGRWFGPKPGQTSILRKPLGYHCPMHPSVRSDKAGDCPICGMKLVPDEDAAQKGSHEGHDHEQKEQRKVSFYRDPKSPNFRSDKPGLNPETGNELEPVYADDPGEMPMGTVFVSATKQQMIGVKFGVAELIGGTQSIRSNAKVTVDETRVAKVQTRIEGWIDKVFVDFTGKLVEKGHPLLTIYSPELVASQQELLLALRSREILRSSPLVESGVQSESLIAAARKRLQLFDLSDAQIEEVIRSGKPLTNVTLYSPISGYVMMRNAFPKQRITPETELYTVVDLSRVWVMADVFENEAAQIQLGMPVRVALSYGSRQKFSGRVSYVQPQVDMTTRTLKVRIEADNPALQLKPDMFVDATFQVARQARVSVPSEAVLDSGIRRTVFVDRGNGYLEPREVEMGDRLENRVEITKGLRPGERIVISGNFLIDSESQLKSAAAGMAGHQHGSGKPSTAPSTPSPGEHKHD